MELVKKVLNEYGYVEEEINEGISFFSKKGEDYFIVANYSEDEILNFSQSDPTLKAYDLMTKFGDVYEDLSKNTSLLVCIKVSDYDSYINEQRNEIYSVEEDPYVFRKYVILFTEESQVNLMSKTVEDVIDLAQRTDNFNLYENRLSRYSSPDYFLALQILIKMPFLELSKEASVLINLPDRLSATLGAMHEVIIDDANNGTDLTVISEQDLASLESVTLLDEWLNVLGERLGKI